MYNKYSVQSNYWNKSVNGLDQCRGGYDISIDNASLAHCEAISNTGGTNVISNGGHNFFISNLSLSFMTGFASGYNYGGGSVTGSGWIKYIII